MRDLEKLRAGEAVGFVPFFVRQIGACECHRVAKLAGFDFILPDRCSDKTVFEFADR